MQPALKPIQEIFERAGWSIISIPASKALAGAFKSSYATAGILIAEDVNEVLRDWMEAQEDLRRLRDSDPTVSENDAYLVIIVPRVNTQAESLREVLNDTFVCRKICVETEGKTITDALSELPFLLAASTVAKTTIRPEIDTATDELSSVLLEDLSKASAEVVLERMLQKKYLRRGT